MAEALQERVLELESDLREERRTRVKLERLLKTSQQERSSLGDDLKIEKKANEKAAAEVRAAHLDKNKLLITVDQLNRKLDAATSELVRLRSEIKLKDKISGHAEPHPPPQPPRRKAKTRSAPSHAMGVLDAEKGAAAKLEELEALLEIANHEKGKAEKQVGAERKKRSAARREMAELVGVASTNCDRGQWALQWVRHGVTAVEKWLGGVRVKDTNSGVWSQGLASTRATIQYMKAVLTSGSEAMGQLQASVDHSRNFCGQPVVPRGAPPRTKVQDDYEAGMQDLIQEAKQMLASLEQSKVEPSVPALRLPVSVSHTPRDRDTKSTPDAREEEEVSSRTVPGPRSKRGDIVLPRSVSERPTLPHSVHNGPNAQRGVKDRSENGRQEDTLRKGVEKAQDGYASRQPVKLGSAEEHEDHVPSSMRAGNGTSRSGGGGYMEQYRKRMHVQQRNLVRA